MKDFKLIPGIMSLLFFLLLTKSAQAYDAQRGNVTATLGSYFFRTNYQSDNQQMNSPTMGGIALTALGDVSDNGSLEITAIYMNKIYFRSEGGIDVAEKTQLLHMTMGYRYWFGSYFSTSLGVYTSYPMGVSTLVHSNAPAGQGLNTTAGEPSESGLDWAIQWEPWNNGRWGAVVEGRYSFSLTKKANEWADQYGTIVGVRYFIQGDSKEASIRSEVAPEKNP